MFVLIVFDPVLQNKLITSIKPIKYITGFRYKIY